MNTTYAAALADEHRLHLQAQANEARLVRTARTTAGAQLRHRYRLPRPLRLRIALRRPVFIGRIRPA
jgi:hypothetical protein